MVDDSKYLENASCWDDSSPSKWMDDSDFSALYEWSGFTFSSYGLLGGVVIFIDSFGKSDILLQYKYPLSSMRTLRNLQFSRSGFSLIELMIVVAILWILFSATQIFSNNAEIYQQRADRLAGLIYDTLRDARQDAIIGRGALSGTTEFVPTSARFVNFASTGTFSQGYYDTDNQTYTGQTWNVPFLDWDSFYALAGFYTSTGGVDDPSASWESTGSISFLFWSGGNLLQINHLPLGKIRSYVITIEYRWFRRYIIGDAIIGNLETRIQNPTGE